MGSRAAKFCRERYVRLMAEPLPLTPVCTVRLPLAAWLRHQLVVHEQHTAARTAACTPSEHVHAAAQAVLLKHSDVELPKARCELASWMDSHIQTHISNGKGLVSWQWELTIFTLLLDFAGIASVFASNRYHADCLMAEASCPAVVRSSRPFVDWEQGCSGIVPGLGFPGMRGATHIQVGSIVGKLPDAARNGLCAAVSY